VRSSISASLLVSLLLAAVTASAQTFTIDDNPFAPIVGPPGAIPGCGAEDQFALAPFFCPPGVAPSPTLAILLPPFGSGSILGPGPVVVLPGPNGFYVDSLSGNRRPPLANIALRFSVDRLSNGAPGTAVAAQAALNQQPADIYESTRSFLDPGVFVGTLVGAPYAGVLPAVVAGAASNNLAVDDSSFGLLAGGAVLGPFAAAPPVGFGTHDNIDAYNEVPLDANGDGLFDVFSYFSVNPDQALASGVAPAFIFDVAAGAPVSPLVPYALAGAMGLDILGGAGSDSIDALVVFDVPPLGGPGNGGPGAQAGLDFALFSLAPGSASLGALGLDAADVFLTDFSGAFALYASSADLGLMGAAGGVPTAGDNVDALEIRRLGDPTFSVDFQGPTRGMPDSFTGTPISEGDILTTSQPGPPGPNATAGGPLPTPGLEVGALAGAPGVVPGGLGILPGPLGFVEVDALSYGRDQGLYLDFSVDEFAAGVPGPPQRPNVASEGIAGAAQASADVFAYLGPVAPTPPGPIFGNTALIDGDGLVPSGRRGVGLIEPNPPTPGLQPDPGDNLDAVDVDTTFLDLAGAIFFSLDAAFPDPLEALPANTGTALANGFSGADVLWSFAGAAAPALAIPAASLGLDLFGFDTDDLDALAFDDADGSLSLTPGDTLYFSVRRGSAVIGLGDSAFGMPIEEGDILMPPTVAGAPPAIFIAAEALGLGTVRSGTAGQFGADDVNAIDLPEPGFAWQLAAGLAFLVTVGRRRAGR
jgi:hypothetical protein